MPFAQEAQVNSVLRPIFSDLAALIRTAHQEWKDSPFAAKLEHPRVRANLIWNLFLYHARHRFEGSKLVSVETKGHWQGLFVGGLYFVRMKKGSDKLLSRNYPTQAALDFNDASVDLFDGVARLDLVYTLDPLQTAVDKIAIAQRHRSKVLWAIDILEGEQDSGQTVINLPKTPMPGSSPADRIVKPKKTAQKVRKTQNGNGGE